MRKLKQLLYLFFTASLILSATACDDDDDDKNPAGNSGNAAADISAAAKIIGAYTEGMTDASTGERKEVDGNYVQQNSAGTVVITKSIVDYSTYPHEYTQSIKYNNYSYEKTTINGTLTGKFKAESESKNSTSLNGTLTDGDGNSVKYDNWGYTVQDGKFTYTGSYIINGTEYKLKPDGTWQ